MDDTKKTRREVLEARLAKAKNDLARLNAQEAQKTRKQQTRAKIVIGGWVLRHRPELVQEVLRNLDSLPSQTKATQIDREAVLSVMAEQPAPESAEIEQWNSNNF